ncbi:hypothetical protein OBBRIDRAFT_358040 [Obba rivulosa]|uniref:Uncharacterized protein n=1 Tax=Obba rivulosa TaxID=1052685 RepID=A0A8E2AI24_9APHY|nr:hypothetical protein OBBRIDRAFT_358040 [Obba rivulosa]
MGYRIFGCRETADSRPDIHCLLQRLVPPRKRDERPCILRHIWCDVTYHLVLRAFARLFQRVTHLAVRPDWKKFEDSTLRRLPGRSRTRTVTLPTASFPGRDEVDEGAGYRALHAELHPRPPSVCLFPSKSQILRARVGHAETILSGREL